MLNVKLASVLCVNYILLCRTSQHFAYTQHIFERTQQRNCSLAPVLFGVKKPTPFTYNV